jgi:hypothetical protein
VILFLQQADHYLAVHLVFGTSQTDKTDFRHSRISMKYPGYIVCPFTRGIKKRLISYPQLTSDDIFCACFQKSFTAPGLC